jgi:hypothetical protein
LNAGFQLKEEVVVQYTFSEGLRPSIPVQDALAVIGSGFFYRLSEEQRGAGCSLKFSIFFVFCTHYLWDVVGNLLGRARGLLKANDCAGLSRTLDASGLALNVCVK